MIKSDQAKLAELGCFVKQARKNPDTLWQTNPLTGQWQLLFRVRNFEPALQGTVVQMPDENGVWKNIHSLWALEFTAEAGNSKTDFKRHHSVAIEWDGLKTLELRLGVRGFGRLEIYDLCLTNGVRTIIPQQVIHGGGTIENLKGLVREDEPHAVFSDPAPTEGFPPIDWGVNQCWTGPSAKGLKFAQRLLQSLDLAAVLGDVAGLEGRLGGVELRAGAGDEGTRLRAHRGPRNSSAAILRRSAGEISRPAWKGTVVERPSG